MMIMKTMNKKTLKKFKKNKKIKAITIKVTDNLH